jgi:AraC-like DNA-binding protein
MAQEPEIYLPKNWGITARLLYGLIFVIAQFRLLTKFRKNYNSNKAAKNLQNDKIIRWLFLFTYVLASFYIVLCAQYLTVFFAFFDLTKLICLSLSGTILFISFYLLTQPYILYGLNIWPELPDTIINGKNVVSENNYPDVVFKKGAISEVQGMAYKSALEKHFRENHPFLKAGYSLNDLSAELGIHAYLLSSFINHNLGKRFNDLINDYRVDYFISLLSDNPTLRSQYTLEAISKQVGFNTQKAFINAVKKRTGKLPSALFVVTQQ